MNGVLNYRFHDTAWDAALAERAIWVPTPVGNIGERALLSQAPRRTFDVTLSSSKIRIELFGEETDWLYSTLQAMQQISVLPANWDSYGSQRIQDAAIVGAMQLLAVTLNPNGVAPMVVPTSVGGLQLEWHQDGFDIEVEFSPTGAASAYLYDYQKDDAWEADRMSPEAAQRIAATLSRLKKQPH